MIKMRRKQRKREQEEVIWSIEITKPRLQRQRCTGFGCRGSRVRYSLDRQLTHEMQWRLSVQALMWSPVAIQPCAWTLHSFSHTLKPLTAANAPVTSPSNPPLMPASKGRNNWEGQPCILIFLFSYLHSLSPWWISHQHFKGFPISVQVKLMEAPANQIIMICSLLQRKYSVLMNTLCLLPSGLLCDSMHKVRHTSHQRKPVSVSQSTGI